MSLPAPSGNTTTAVGVIGLGIMGSAFSANLIQAGFAVIGTDVRAAARATLEKAGGTPVADSREVGRRCRFIVTSLATEAALADVAAQLAEAAAAGAIIIETSTFLPAVKQQAHDQLARQGVILLDCPVSGTGSQAWKRDLAIFASGDPAAIEKARPVIAGFTRACYEVGAFGNGMKVKAVANLLVGVHTVAAAEALLLAQRSGLDLNKVIEAVGDGGGGSRMFQVRGPLMANRAWNPPNMKNSVWQKDLQMIAHAIEEAHSPSPLFSLTLPLWRETIETGHGEHDMSAIFEVYEHMCRETFAND
jgi:3-hydroxyisobutyrate dehydrogenase-like beta-hydroxyacid dehydrogenase